ncbi:MAG: hypothetical protein QXF12_00470 [Candidatus Aenigmatarchaeota archaeon]
MLFTKSTQENLPFQEEINCGKIEWIILFTDMLDVNIAYSTVGLIRS